MREAIGADAARVLPLLDKHAFTFLVEDPATVWNLGPQRYQTIAERYRKLTTHREKLAIDLNIVDRYQDVYPTKQQTGVELFQLVHSAAANFSRVALYFENSLLPPDIPLLPSAAAVVTRMEKMGSKTVVESAGGVGIPWKGPALVDGQAWPAADPETVWLPAGAHSVEAGTSPLKLHLVWLNGDLKASHAHAREASNFRTKALRGRLLCWTYAPQRVEIDGAARRLALPVRHNFAAAGTTCRDIGHPVS